jgi:hypothetical protein
MQRRPSNVTPTIEFAEAAACIVPDGLRHLRILRAATNRDTRTRSSADRLNPNWCSIFRSAAATRSRMNSVARYDSDMSQPVRFIVREHPKRGRCLAIEVMGVRSIALTIANQARCLSISTRELPFEMVIRGLQGEGEER